MQDELVALMPELTRLARTLSRDRTQAEDLLQETLVRVWARDPDRIGNLGPYARTAARNLARRPLPGVVPLDAADEPGAPPEAESTLMLRDLARALSQLPLQDVRLILSVATGFKTYAEIAADADIPVGTVMSRLARARQRLRALCGVSEAEGVAGLLPEHAA